MRNSETEEPTQHAPVILLTGESSLKDFKAGVTPGQFCIVTKPFKSESLLKAVRMPSPAQHVHGD
jgi:DNA-binding response OmpR family regulator